MAAEINNPRRYYLLKSQYYRAAFQRGLSMAFLGKQESMSGTPLPLTVPHQAKLATAHYTTVEDLTGADVNELVKQGLSSAEANAVLKALL